MKKYIFITGVILFVVLMCVLFIQSIEQGYPSTINDYLEEKPYYSINAIYPKDIAQIDAAISDTIKQFKEENHLDSLTAEDIQTQGLGGDRKYTLSITPKKYQSTTTLSYVFTIIQDTLGAHPNAFYRTFTFDREGREVTLESLFVSGSNYLERISTLAYDKVVATLRERAGEPTPEMLDEVRIGTSPTSETLQFFYIDGSDLHLLFPPYQVAAYAAGSFDIAIPLSELQDILK